MVGWLSFELMSRLNLAFTLLPAEASYSSVVHAQNIANATHAVKVDAGGIKDIG